MKLSIAICTWNRAKVLGRALDTISNAVAPTAQWEVIVVNNNCTDATEEVLDSFASRLPLRRVFEPQAGLSNARNAAVKCASGDYIIWTDDDVLVDKEWIVAYERAFVRWPEAAVFGGPIRPWFEGIPPQWLAAAWKDVSGAFAVRDLGPEPLSLDGRGVTPYGANFAVRLAEQRRFLFDPDLGRKLRSGGCLGEELVVIRAVIDSGCSGWWVPDASVDHVIPKERQTLAYLRNFYELAGKTAQKLNPAEGVAWFGRPRWVWRKAFAAEIIYQIRRFRGNPQECIKSLRDAAYHRGMLARGR